MLDVLTYDGGQHLADQQQEDLLAFGKIICALGCQSLTAIHNLVKAVETLARAYSPDLRDVAIYLLQPAGPGKSIQGLMEKLWARSLDELTSAFKCVMLSTLSIWTI